ncbi:MAG: hypothetical protein AAGB22_11035, partial [Bacteroidota bacterium]
MKTFKWLWTSLLFGWLMGAAGTAQTTIWSEDFESYSDEYTGSGMDLNTGDAGSDWTHTAANALVAKVDDDDVAIING